MGTSFWLNPIAQHGSVATGTRETELDVIGSERLFMKMNALLQQDALDLPFLDINSLAKGYGCATTNATTKEEIQKAFNKALATDGPTVITIPIKREHKSLVPSDSKH